MDSSNSMASYNIESIQVLVIDEHVHLRAAICDVLRNLGVRNIREADSIERGYVLTQEINPDLIFIDWTPDFDGIGLLQKIRTDPKSPNPYVAVIVMTGFSESEYVISARDAGMDRYLAKPVSPQTIYKHIVALIENRKTFVKSDEFFGPDRRRKRQSEFQGEDNRDISSGDK
jgi:two-component system, chemotaxis family, chemotaxis protein CheY